VIGVSKPMPRVFGYEYCSSLLKWVPHIVQYENSAAFQNVEGLVHLEVSVDRNACADRHLLGPQGQIVRTCGNADPDEDVAMVAKMNEMFAFAGAEDISLWRRTLSQGDALR